LDFADNKIVSLQDELFLKMNHLQILDLQGNNLRHLPTSIGFLRSLNTLLIGRNPFNIALDTLISPIIQSQNNENEVLGNSPAALIKNRRVSNSRMKLSSPGYPYVLRLQGYLCDVYDLGNTELPNKPAYTLDIDTEYLTAYCHLPVTNPLENTQYREKIVEELISTEENYVAQLGLVIDLYCTPLQNILDQATLNLLFSNIADIHYLHFRHTLFNVV
jgi:Leucine-rich repeat (LRR) protein